MSKQKLAKELGAGISILGALYGAYRLGEHVGVQEGKLEVLEKFARVPEVQESYGPENVQGWVKTRQSVYRGQESKYLVVNSFGYPYYEKNPPTTEQDAAHEVMIQAVRDFGRRQPTLEQALREAAIIEAAKQQADQGRQERGR